MPKGIPNNPQNPENRAEKPTVKAFSVQRRAGGWVMVTYIIKGNQLLKTEATQPDLKILAIEAFKIAALKYWNAQ